MYGHIRLNILFLFTGLLLTGITVTDPNFSPSLPIKLAPEEMDYHDFAETETALQWLDAVSPYVMLETIGESIDYETNPSNPTGYPIYALRISADTPPSDGDRHDRNAILFNCAVHAREWLTAESCLHLAVYLVENRTNNATVVPELLEHTEVWIIPMANPAGRVLDDQYRGDPTQFHNTPPWTTGWRNNADTRLCNMGVNVVRNFSSGFNDHAADVFCSSRYRGFAPFSSSEANALREFVNNHMISFAVTAHSNGQLIWNQWGGDDDAGERMIEQAASTWRLGGWSTVGDQNKYDLGRSSVGGGNGQFSAWLAETSDRSENESDETISPWAYSGDLPIAGDFDSDGQADDVAIYRTPPGVGDQYYWYYDYDHDGDTDESHGPWATQTGYRPFAGDFDRDGEMDDVAAFRPDSHTWYFDYNHNGTSNEVFTTCGTACQHPVALDYDGDGFVDDRAAFCTSDRKWYFDTDHNCTTDGIVGPWGLAGDLPIAGDFDRDNQVDDLAVYRPSTQMWYYDINHDGTTDHVSGPWGSEEGLPIAGNFNAPETKDPDRMDDVGLFIPSSRLWQYDYYHNATYQQLDDGTRRGIQTIMLELPVSDNIYTTSMYIQSPGDGSNGFHPSANVVVDMINDAFEPMALYLIRQARAPGCPTNSSGSAESTYCPSSDAGLVGAKIIPAMGSDDSPGILKSVAAERTSWSNTTPASEQLPWGQYHMIYRVQNFSTATATYRVSMTIKRWDCLSSGSCYSTSILSTNRSHSLLGRTAVSDDFSFWLTYTAIQDLPPSISVGDHYEIILEVSLSGGGKDNFTENDTKIFKFRVLPPVFLPLVMH
jgi:hypothetical protein